MEDFRQKRTNNFSNSSGGTFAKGQMYGPHQPPRHVAGRIRHMYQPNTNPAMAIGRTDDMSALTENFGRLSVQSSGYHVHTKPNHQIHTHPSEFNGLTLPNGLPLPTQTSDVSLGRQAFMHNGQLMFAAPHVSQMFGQSHVGHPSSPGMYAPVGHQFIMPGGYGNTHHMVNGNTPLSQGWNSSRVPSSDMPTLITPPRDSTSSNEDDAPGTPFTQYTGYGAYPPGVAVIDRSPHSVYAWSTPSPAQQAFAMGKSQVPNSISPRLQLLVQQTPAIPKAIPAPYSPMKPLDRSLENPNGVTNVYIRGLLPTTTDEMLYNLASRFGEIMSSKSIIDHTSGLCKGYVKYSCNN